PALVEGEVLGELRGDHVRWTRRGRAFRSQVLQRRAPQRDGLDDLREHFELVRSYHLGVQDEFLVAGAGRRRRELEELDGRVEVAAGGRQRGAVERDPDGRLEALRADEEVVAVLGLVQL